jgi:tRNA(Ile2) C34 agmatinyltransferase TiaS
LGWEAGGGPAALEARVRATQRTWQHLALGARLADLSQEHGRQRVLGVDQEGAVVEGEHLALASVHDLRAQCSE